MVTVTCLVSGRPAGPPRRTAASPRKRGMGTAAYPRKRGMGTAASPRKRGMGTAA